MLSESRESVENDMYFKYQTVPYLSSPSGINIASEEIPDAESWLSKGLQARLVSDIV